MKLSTLDLVVLIVYFGAMICIGFYIKRRASKNLESYFLGERKLPWWLLGISNASAMWDITGTMWLVYSAFRLRYEGYLSAVDLAHLQPDL